MARSAARHRTNCRPAPACRKRRRRARSELSSHSSATASHSESGLRRTYVTVAVPTLANGRHQTGSSSVDVILVLTGTPKFARAGAQRIACTRMRLQGAPAPGRGRGGARSPGLRRGSGCPRRSVQCSVDVDKRPAEPACRRLVRSLAHVPRPNEPGALPGWEAGRLAQRCPMSNRGCFPTRRVIASGGQAALARNLGIIERMSSLRVTPICPLQGDGTSGAAGRRRATGRRGRARRVKLSSSVSPPPTRAPVSGAGRVTGNEFKGAASA